MGLAPDRLTYHIAPDLALDADPNHVLAPLLQLTSNIGTPPGEFTQQVRKLCQVEVTEAQWQDFLLAHAPDTGSKRSQTIAGNRRGELRRLWQVDNRVSLLARHGVGSAAGGQHLRPPPRHRARRIPPERNLSRAVTDHADTFDSTTLSTLDTVPAAA